MVSDTNIKKKSKKSRTGGLTLRILSVNVLPLLVLVVGLLSLGKYQENLIRDHLQSLEERAQNFAVAIEGPEESAALIPAQAQQIIMKFGEKRKDTRIRLFDAQGNIIIDSFELLKLGEFKKVTASKKHKKKFSVSIVIAYLGTQLLELLPSKTALLPFPQDVPAEVKKYPDIKSFSRSTAWKGGMNKVILTATAPIIKNDEVIGVILLTNDGHDIESSMDRVRLDVLTATLAALSITIFLSIYLAGIIGRPLKKLAVAAEKVRQNKGREVNIPDLSHRRDEIGELSMALRHMTQALWDRMDSIENFAADVSHEIKNPLTSLRSAVETVSKVKSQEDRDRLMDIIHHDIQRLDRLISDISSASRLDAALSRDKMGDVDLQQILQQLVEAHKSPIERGNKEKQGKTPINLKIPHNKNIMVHGNKGRLAQVFDNLIDNALSFSPENGTVTVRILPDKKHITIEVEDKGPGIPENNLNDIFQRFYSERPKNEGFGSHSGLGLSIAKQIITNHNGEIHAENIMGNEGIQGARFTVILNKSA